jgi:hypothetical protein
MSNDSLVKDLNNGYNEYFAERLQNDIDLVVTIGDLLIESGIKTERVQDYYDAPLIMDAGNKRPVVQRFLLNRYWTTQLLSLDINTVDIRFSLFNDGTIDDWLNVFKEITLPVILKNNLPIKI